MIVQIIGWVCICMAASSAYLLIKAKFFEAEGDEIMELQFCLFLIAAAICFK